MQKADGGSVFLQERTMTVCSVRRACAGHTPLRLTGGQVCGAFMQHSDVAAGRIKAHLNGKQHTGYALIRETAAALRVRAGRRRDRGC
jgi:hypothetical protein